MDFGIMWIFIIAVGVVFGLAVISQVRGRRAAAKYRADYDHSLRLQEEMVEHLREIRSALQRLENKSIEGGPRVREP
jgi:hypothetical protein